MTRIQRARILIVVDGEPEGNKTLSGWLEAEGYEPVIARDADEARAHVKGGGCSVLLADVAMDEKSGCELVAKIKEEHPAVVSLMVSRAEDRKKVLQFMKAGAYGSIAKPLEQEEVVLHVANAVERSRLLLASQEAQNNGHTSVGIGRREENTILRLVWAAECRDEATGDHIRRMGLYAGALAEALGWEAQAVEDIRLAATMHDIGKIGIADGILLRAERLTSEEFAVLKRHTEMGARILEGSDIPMLQMARDIALCHHERWDGSGYSQGLAGEEIPESARIVTILDVYDALSHPRVYRPAHPEDEVTNIMADGRGKHFDPRIFDAFLDVKPTFQNIRRQVEEEGAPF